ncbi:ribonuclease H-like domain-containing protein [Tanacetum coccineum]
MLHWLWTRWTQCFEKICYHVCYKGKKNKKGGKLAANVVFGLKTPFDMGYENELQGEQSNPGLNHKLVMKMVNGKNHVTNNGVAPGFMHHACMSLHARTFALSSQSNITCTSMDPSSSTSQNPTVNSINVFDFLNSPVVTNSVHHNAADLHTLHRDKFDPKGIRCVLIGYPPGHNGYKLYSLKTHEVLHSRDVIFQENVFPFKEYESSSNSFPTKRELQGEQSNPGLNHKLVMKMFNGKNHVTNNGVAPCFMHHATHYKAITKFLRFDNGTEVENVFPFKEYESSSNSFPTKRVHYPGFTIDEDAQVPVISSTNYNPSQNDTSIPHHEDNADPLINPTVENNETFASILSSPSASSLDVLIIMSSRNTTAPKWLKDFAGPKSFANTVQHQPLHPLFTQHDFKDVPQHHIAFLANVFDYAKPVSYSQACRSVERLKERLVVKGFNQKEGLDYKHTFSPVAKLDTIRVLIALATIKGWPLHQLDVNNAFLHGYIDEEIYMLPPEGYTKAKQVKEALDNKFIIKDMGEAKYFLGIEVCRTAAGTHLNQRKYILDLLQDSDLIACKPNSPPLSKNLHLSLDKGVPLCDARVYRRLVSRLGKLFNDNEIFDWLLYFPCSFLSLMENKEVDNCV